MSHQQAGIHHLIDKTWTPEQAAAIYEFLNDLTKTVSLHYGVAIHEKYKQDLHTRFGPSADSSDQHPELPF